MAAFPPSRARDSRSRRTANTRTSSTRRAARACSRRIGFMAKEQNWAFPAELRPKPEDWRFDLDRALDAVVNLRSLVPDDAFTAPLLGTERVGNGIVIREDGLVLT